jgi:hypothetical protein
VSRAAAPLLRDDVGQVLRRVLVADALVRLRGDEGLAIARYRCKRREYSCSRRNVEAMLAALFTPS